MKLLFPAEKTSLNKVQKNPPAQSLVQRDSIYQIKKLYLLAACNYRTAQARIVVEHIVHTTLVVNFKL